MNKKFAFVGDIALTGLFSYDSENNHKRLNSAYRFLNEFDMVFANYEAPIKSGKNINKYKNFAHYSLYKPSREILKNLNIKCVSLANNHIYDFQMPGLKKTIKMFEELNIMYTGAGWKKKHIEPVIFLYDNLRYAFLAYVDIKTNPKTEKFSEIYVNYLDEKKILNDIKKLKNVDKIILSLHWGIDYSFYPEKYQIDLARKFVDAGVDVVYGHHPHTIQPFEIYQNKYIFYSMGGLVFGDYKKTPDSKIQALFRKTKRGLIASYDTKKNEFGFTSTYEKKGNFLKITNNSYRNWSNLMWLFFRIKNYNNILRNLFLFKENIIDRVCEYFFGYYKNPILRLFQFHNLKKIRKLFKN